MSRVAKARGYAQGRIFEPGDPVPADIGPATWIAETEADAAVPVPEEPDNLGTRTAKALRDIAKAEKVKVETDDNKADLIRKIRAARDAGPAPEKE